MYIQQKQKETNKNKTNKETKTKKKNQSKTKENTVQTMDCEDSTTVILPTIRGMYTCSMLLDIVNLFCLCIYLIG